MISVVVYGRNDTHGYNPHRRAALSLNCIAEILDAPDDEIVFVDYNTPDELPTLIEAISDTLTPRCLDTLRVLRVPASVHEARFGTRTHLPAVEPIARNVAARRSNPANRWLLSTNTDMVLLPTRGSSLSAICADLADGYYGLPRFELPEWLWERLPRHDPERSMAEIRRLGWELRLDEPTVSHDWIRFDAPGDFQLVLRDDFFEIDGFDEEMLLGWHVDSNLSRRMVIHRGSIGSLERDLAGYHCNHSRTPTVYHGEKWIANDYGKFFFAVDQPGLPAQRNEWGLAEMSFEEIPVRERTGRAFADALSKATAAHALGRVSSNAWESEFELTYDTGHVLPFIGDSLVVSPVGTRIGYLGANPVLERMLADTVAAGGIGTCLSARDLPDGNAARDLSDAADLFVIDFGLDAGLTQPSLTAGRPTTGLLRVFDLFRQLVDLERERLGHGEHPRRFVLVNSTAAYWNAYVLSQMDCSPSTFHSRVRRALVRPHQENTASANALAAGQRLLRWTTRHENGSDRRLHLRNGETAALADLENFGGFGSGWTHPDPTAIWTQGELAELGLALDQVERSKLVLELEIGKVGIRSGEQLLVTAFANGARLGRRRFTTANPPPTWRVPLPVEVLETGTLDVTFACEEPASWAADDRRLGLYVRSISLRKDDWRHRVRIAAAYLRRRLRRRAGAAVRAIRSLRRPPPAPENRV